MSAHCGSSDRFAFSLSLCEDKQDTDGSFHQPSKEPAMGPATVIDPAAALLYRSRYSRRMLIVRPLAQNLCNTVCKQRAGRTDRLTDRALNERSTGNIEYHLPTLNASSKKVERDETKVPFSQRPRPRSLEIRLVILDTTVDSHSLCVTHNSLSLNQEYQ